MNKGKGALVLFAKRKQIITILLCLIIVMIAIGSIFVINALNIAVSSAESAYSDSLKMQREETYQAFYQTSFDIAEEKYHVENAVTISVEDVRESAELEVLRVSDIEYIYSKEDEDARRWTAVKGYGIYTVNLSMGEFLIDNTRHYVLVRVPEPELARAGLDYEYESYLFEDGIFNGSIREGVDLAREDLKSAQNQLQIKLTSNQLYYESAQKCTEEIIRNLVKNCNPDVSDLIVNVEFID